MRNNPIKMLFPFLSVLLLAPWPIAYAFDSGRPQEQPIQIEAAAVTAAPQTAVFRNAIGSVESGDLFYVDARDSTADVMVTLYLTNAPELIRDYSYILLKVGVYAQTSDGIWEAASNWNGEAIPETYLTLRNGLVGFTLVGDSRYKIAIDEGNFYCCANGDSSRVTPRFYLTAE